MNPGSSRRWLPLAGLAVAAVFAGALQAAEAVIEADPDAGQTAVAVEPASGPPESDVAAEAVSAAPDPGIVPRPRFDGAWEKDFTRSDRWEDELGRQLEQMRRDAERGYQLETRRAPGTILGTGRRARSSANIIELAQLAGFINRQTTLRIQQSAVEIRIVRTYDADLVCSTQESVTYSWEDLAGEEVCGWDGNQLLFSITLPEGVQIVHRFSLSDDGQWLNMATTTSSASASFTQIQFFYRYDVPSENYTCIQTISRGNTCSLRDSVQYD